MTRTSNAGNILLGIFAIATVRNFLEFALEGQTLVSNADPLRDLKTYFLHFTSFYYLVFVCLSLIFYAFALKRLTISECFKIGALAMPMIWIGPVFGYLIGDPCDILYPNDPMGVLLNLHQMANPNYDYNGMTKGMRLEVMLAGLGAIGYLYYKTKRVLTSVLGGICISAACLAIGLSIPFLTQYYEYGFHFGKHELYNSTLLHQGFVVHGTGCKIALFYIILSLILFSVAYYLRSPQYFLAIVKNFRWTRTLHYLLLFGGGLLYVYHNPPAMNPGYDGEFEYLATIWKHPFDLFGIAMAALAVFLSFQSAVIFNDIHDYDIDVVSNAGRPLVTKAIPLSEYKLVGRLFLTLALVIAVCINETFFFFVLLYNLLAFLYSAPPFRLRKYFLLSNFILAAIFLVTLHAGSSVLISSYRFGNIPSGITWSLLLGFVLALTVKDVKDYEGDRLGRVQTLQTLMGRRVGNVATVVAVCLATLLMPILLGLDSMVLFCVAVCALFLLVVNKVTGSRTRELLVTILYFIYMLVLFCCLAY